MREQALRVRLLFLQQHRAGIYPQTDVRSPLYSPWHGAQPYLSAQLFTWQNSCSVSFSSSSCLSFIPSLDFPRRPACIGTFTFPQFLLPPPLLHSPHCLKSKRRSHINSVRSKALICFAGETVTYWCRSGYTQMKKARRPGSQNISVLTQTFTPLFTFDHLLSQKKAKHIPKISTCYVDLWSPPVQADVGGKHL